MQSTKKLDHIDTIRGIAILMVILVHTSNAVHNKAELTGALAAYGQMGVQLFFLASAFTLCHSWDLRKNDKNKLLNYSIRRFFRIAPPYYAGILIYFLIDVLENIYRSQTPIITEKYTALNIASNILLLHGLYPQANNNIVPGGWSIGTEVIFYTIFPILFAWLSRIKDIGILPSISITIIAEIITQALLFAIYTETGDTAKNNTFLYFNIITQAPTFLVGMLVYLLKKGNRFPSIPARTSLAGFILLSIGSFTLLSLGDRDHTFFNTSSIAPLVAALSYVFLFDILETSKRLNGRWIRNVGTASYSMYLLHFIFASKFTSLFSNRLSSLIGPDAAMVSLCALSILATYLAAAVSERFFESYFIAAGRNLIARLSSQPVANN